jgi:rubredoxin
MSERDDAAYIEHLEAKVAKLEDEIKRLKKEKGLSSAREGLTFEKRTGVWLDANTHTRYCPKCADQEKRNPLMEDRYSYRCTVCGHSYHNPDSPPPQVISSRPRGGRI